MNGEGVAEKADLFIGKAREVVKLKIRLFDDSGKMLPNALYHLEVGDEKFDGTASNGWVEQKLKSTATPDDCWLEWEKDQSGNFLYSMELNLKFGGKEEESLVKHLKNIGYIPDPKITGISDITEDFKHRFYLRGNVKREAILKLSGKGVEDVKSGAKLLASLQ